MVSWYVFLIYLSGMYIICYLKIIYNIMGYIQKGYIYTIVCTKCVSYLLNDFTYGSCPTKCSIFGNPEYL